MTSMETRVKVAKVDAEAIHELEQKFVPPLNGLDPKALLLMGPTKLGFWQSTFGFGDELGFIKIPQYLRNPCWHASDSYVDIRHVLSKHTSSTQDLELAICTLVRWFLICLSVPTTASNFRHAVLLAPTTVFSRLSGLMIPLAKASLKTPARKDGLFFARVKKFDFVEADDGKSRRFALEFRRLNYLARRGMWIDEPTDKDAEIKDEPSNISPARTLKSPPKLQEWKPLPDALTHAAGLRSAWIVEHLAPVLLDAFEQTIAMRSGFSVQQSYIPGNRFLSSYVWHISGVENNKGLPFQTDDMTWPPTNTFDLLVWLKLVQQANTYITGLSTGPRASETLSWRTDCLVEASDGVTVAKGRTFKIVAPVDGAPAVWPLPRVAVLAVYQQVRLSLLLTKLAQKIEVEKLKMPGKISVRWEPIAKRLDELELTITGGERFCGIRAFSGWSKGGKAHINNVELVATKLDIPLEELLAPTDLAVLQKLSEEKIPEPLKPQPLWRVFGGKGKGNALTGTYNEDFREYIKTLGLLHLTDDQKLVYHRFRKTIARIVALCIAHAPHILMDIFGHEDIDMTLHYILADPSILADIDAIQREIKVMKATELIQSVDDCGGPAAKRLKEAINLFKMGKDDFGTEDVYEAAVLWTLDGRTWDYMGQGRFCLKGPLDQAPCAKGNSIANKAKCKKSCDHRLCAPEGIRDSDEAIRSAVIHLEEAWATDNSMMSTQWSGQILAKIDDHEQLFEKWKTHAVVARVLSQAGRNAVFN